MAEVVTEQPAALGGPGGQQAADLDADTPSADVAPGQREVIAGCPPGLEHLAVAHRIQIKQQFELAEVLTGFETANHYVLLNAQNQQIYVAAEQSDCLLRCCCGARRAFDMLLIDNTRLEVARFSRAYRCCGNGGCTCWPRCCMQRLEVTRAGVLLGVVTQDPSLCSSSFSVRSAEGDTVLRVQRRCCNCTGVCPLFGCCCPGCREVRFSISNEDGQEVGAITQKWGGAVKEALTDADSFAVDLPRELDVKVKVTVLAAVFLLDFMYFENNRKKQVNQGGIIIGSH